MGTFRSSVGVGLTDARRKAARPTHCAQGHEYAVVGRYKRDGRPGGGMCKACKRSSYDRRKLADRATRHKRLGPKFDAAARRNIATNRIVELGRQLEHAMPWDRAAIRAAIEQEQREAANDEP